jgi:phospholipase/carboxylesterase
MNNYCRFEFKIKIIIVLAFSLFIQCRTVNTDPQTILTHIAKEPANRKNDAPILILLHGYGSNEQDLYALAKYLPPNYRVISARAPLQLGHDRFAWYSLEMSQKPYVHNEAEANKAQLKIINFITALKKKYKLKTNKILLAGFSQGGIMSYHVALKYPQLIDGIGIIGGRMLTETKKQCKMNAELKKLSIWIGHGIEDNILEIENAREANQFFQSLSLNTSYHEYENTAHEINEKMLLDFIEWLKEMETKS